MQKEHLIAKGEVARLNQAVERYKKLFRKIRHRYRTAKRHTLELEGRIKDLADHQSMETQKQELLDQLTEKVRKREIHLNNYVQAAERDKAKLRQYTVELAQEIRFAKSVNPLKEYYAIIEKEISRAEIRLSHLPQFASERKNAEADFSQLIEQRDSVRDLIRRAETQLEKQAQELAKMARSLELIPLPPLPPVL